MARPHPCGRARGGGRVSMRCRHCRWNCSNSSTVQFYLRGFWSLNITNNLALFGSMYRLKILCCADQASILATILIAPSLPWAAQGCAGSLWKSADEGVADAGGWRINPLRRGLYLRDSRVNPLALAPAIHGPSYVSFESALAWHGLIPERVEEVVCATFKRPAEFETPVGRYR